MVMLLLHVQLKGRLCKGIQATHSPKIMLPKSLDSDSVWDKPICNTAKALLILITTHKDYINSTKFLTLVVPDYTVNEYHYSEARYVLFLQQNLSKFTEYTLY